jgi:hypothetical protein
MDLMLWASSRNHSLTADHLHLDRPRRKKYISVPFAETAIFRLMQDDMVLVVLRRSAQCTFDMCTEYYFRALGALCNENRGNHFPSRLEGICS